MIFRWGQSLWDASAVQAIKKKTEFTQCVLLSRCVNQIDTDLSEMSVHLLGIHAVPPPDCMLSVCQTSRRGESHQRVWRSVVIFMIAIHSSQHYWLRMIFWDIMVCSLHRSVSELWWGLHICSLRSSWRQDDNHHQAEKRREGKVWTFELDVWECPWVCTLREGADEPHSMLGMVLRGTPRFIPPPQQNPPKH